MTPQEDPYRTPRLMSRAVTAGPAKVTLATRVGVLAGSSRRSRPIRHCSGVKVVGMARILRRRAARPGTYLWGRITPAGGLSHAF